MARPAISYRGARRNHHFGRAEGGKRYPFLRLSGSNWRRQFDAEITERPVQMRGFNYKHGGRELREKLRGLFSEYRKTAGKRWLSGKVIQALRDGISRLSE